jgi:hypothetical protein
MRTISCCILVLALVFVFAGESFAKTGADMKASPLFKASLQQTIERLEGKVEEQGAVETPTGKGVCPNAPVTWSPTCSDDTRQPTFCGGWCVTTWNTCNETCYCNCVPTSCNTCASTCANTCVGGSCTNYRFVSNGQVQWLHNQHSSNDWWNLLDGYYDCLLQQGGGAGRVVLNFNNEGYPPLDNPDGVFYSQGNFDLQKVHPIGVRYVFLSPYTKIAQSCSGNIPWSSTYVTINNPLPGGQPNYCYQMYIGY